MLFTEAAEGGAGVLRRIQHDKDALGEAARAALEICHFDPDTGEDKGARRSTRSAPGAATPVCSRTPTRRTTAS